MTDPSSEEEKQQDTSNHGNRAIITVLAATALALASGTSLAAQYAVQLALGSITIDFGVSAAVAGKIVTAVMAGYFIGMVLLVPLANRFSPGRLVPVQLAGLAVVLAAAASAPTAGVLVGVFGLVGVTSKVAAEAVSVVGRLRRLRFVAVE